MPASVRTRRRAAPVQRCTTTEVRTITNTNAGRRRNGASPSARGSTFAQYTESKTPPPLVLVLVGPWRWSGVAGVSLDRVQHP